MENEGCKPKIIKDDDREKVFTVVDSRGNDLGVRVEAHLIDGHYVMAYTGIREPLREDSSVVSVGAYKIFRVRDESQKAKIRGELEEKLKEIFIRYVEQHNGAVEGRLAHPGIVG
jgi:hypothetical protein